MPLNKFSEDKMLKMTKKIISLLLAAVMLIGCFGIVATAAADDGYSIVFNYDVEKGYGDAKVFIKGGEYSVGRYGLKYNTSLLKLVKVSGATVTDFAATDAFSDIVKGYADDEYSVLTTAETNTTEDMISATRGNIYFAWVKNDLDISSPAIDATQAAKQIATIYFALADGASADDLKSATNLFSVVQNTNLPDGWSDAYETAKYNGAAGSEIVNLTPATVNGQANEITIDISDVTGVTYEVGRTVIKVKLPGALNSNDGMYSVITAYEVSILDENGNVVENTATIVEKSNINVQDGLTLPEFNAENNGIESGKTYKIVVTPITESDKKGASKIVENVVTEGNGAVPEGGGGGVVPPAGGGGGGAAPAQYTLQFDAGEGKFPENEKHTFSVAPNALISEFPAVIAPVGMKFIGWSLDGEHVADLSAYKVKANTTLTALYEIDGVHETFISGYPDGTVGPEKGLTRAEAAAIIARASQDFDESKTYTSNFADVSSDEWYANYVSFVYEKGIVTGYADNTFLPSNLITRAEAVTILNRLSGRTANTKAIDNYIKDNGIPFNDLEKGTWYFYEVMEAAFRHMIYYFHN